MQLPNFNINPYVQPYTGGVSQEFGQAVDQRIKTYEAAQEFDDVLGFQTDTLLQNVAPFDNDIAYAKELMHGTRQNISERAKKGDYENMLREVKRNARNFAGQVQPLIENQKRYNDYLTTLKDSYSKGDISLDTYSKAQSSALSNYKGLDKNNIQGSFFRGFQPSKDVNVSETIDKFLTGWKADGTAKLVPDGQGGYAKISWEGASEAEIAMASQNYLMGDQTYMGYAQTQNAIGNVDRVTKETTEAILAGMKKHGFNKSDVSLQWEPEWINGNKKILEYARLMGSSPSSATTNPGAVDIFDQLGLSQDETTGKVILSPDVTRAGGKLYKYVDNGGNTISKKDYDSQTAAIGIGIDPKDTEANKKALRATGPRMVEITSEQAETYNREANQALVQMASEKFLQNAVKTGKINSDVLNDPAMVNEYLRINQKQYTTPEYLKNTRKNYNEAIKNAQQIYDNTRWDISEIPGTATPEFTSIKDDDILANLTGQSIGILDTQIGGFRKGQKADLNSMLEKITEDGYKIKAVRRLGPLKYNPYNNTPAMSYAFNLEDEDGKAKTIEVAASIQDQDIQPVQDVFNLAYKGLSGEIPFYAPNSSVGNVSGKFRVHMTTDKNESGKNVFNGFVEVLDATGKKVSDPNFPQNIPISQFADVYKSLFAPTFINKYINPKLKK